MEFQDKTGCSQGHIKMVDNEGLQQVSCGFLDQPPLRHQRACLVPTLSSHCHLQRRTRRSTQIDLASIQQAQWTLSAMSSSDLHTLSRVINQPNGFPLLSLGTQLITHPSPTASDQITPMRSHLALQCHALHRHSFLS